MATPATAGAAALVRHYFAGGEYAKQVLSSGIDCSASYAAPYCQSYNASGELVKGNTSRVPVAVIRGREWERDDDASMAPVLRDSEKDLFR